MPNVKISGLPAATSVTAGTDVAPLVSGGITTKATPQQIVNSGLLAPGAIGGTTPSTGKFTTIESTIATGTAPLTVASTTNVANLNASSLSGATFASPGAIGSGTASTGAFTTLSASSTVSGTGFSNYLLSPPAIGTTTPGAGKFTTLTATSTTTLATSLTGLIKTASGVVSNASAGTDYTSPTGTENLSNKTITSSSLNSTPIGASSASTGKFTTMQATSTSYIGGASGIGAMFNVRQDSSSVPSAEIENEAASGKMLAFTTNGESLVGWVAFTIGGVTYNTASDERLKIDKGVSVDSSVIDNTIIHDFEWKMDGSAGKGVFAQEAINVNPSAVSSSQINDLNDNGLPTNPWGVDYSKYVPDLIVYCQQLKKEITELKSLITAA